MPDQPLHDQPATEWGTLESSFDCVFSFLTTVFRIIGMRCTTGSGTSPMIADRWITKKICNAPISSGPRLQVRRQIGDFSKYFDRIAQ